MDDKLFRARFLGTRPRQQKEVVIAGGYKSKVQGWRTYPDSKKYYMKSLWEINYGHYLQHLKNRGKIKEWEYEPELFRFPKEDYDAGPFLYKPDFRITRNDGTHVWHEVKGWMNKASEKKTKRFRKHYPDEELVIIDGTWFSKHTKRLRSLIPSWEKLPDKKS